MAAGCCSTSLSEVLACAKLCLHSQVLVFAPAAYCTPDSALLPMQAAPSAAEVLYHTFKEKKTQLNAKTKASVVDRYGSVGQAPPDEELLLGQTERCGS